MTYKYINHVSQTNSIKLQILSEEIYLCDTLLKSKKYKDGNQTRTYTFDESNLKYIYSLRNDAVIKYNALAQKKVFKTKNYLFARYKNYMIQFTFILLATLLVIILGILL